MEDIRREKQKDSNDNFIVIVNKQQVKKRDEFIDGFGPTKIQLDKYKEGGKEVKWKIWETDYRNITGTTKWEWWTSFPVPVKIKDSRKWYEEAVIGNTEDGKNQETIVESATSGKTDGWI